MQKNNKKKIFIGIMIGSGVTVLTLGILVLGWLICALFGDNREITTDISKYEEVMGMYEDNNEVYSGFITFPETIPDSATDIDYYSSYDVFIAGRALCEVYLQCTYDEEAYQAEIERLESTYKQYGATKKTLLYDAGENFAYPAYIAVDGYAGDFEYALLSGENEITYICICCYGEDSLGKVQGEFLPKNSASVRNQTTERQRENYSIYTIENDEHPGEYLHSHTRDAWVAMDEHHYVKIDYNLFYVNTYLDDTDTEIIRDCSFVYHTSKHDAFYGLPDEIVYKELQGYKFKSLELNEEQTIATVTYYDGDEEKTREYVIPEM